MIIIDLVFVEAF